MSHVIALLGPTNTGKTFTAMERMLAHHSGVMGFPLRLLARENYERAARLKGRDAVALITGEEKIVPSRARYFLCTVESMPLDLAAEFVGVDEIQLASDPERGHVFTDRLFYMRGTAETLFLGASTIAPLLRQLLPEVEIRTQPRFSTLTYTSPKKLSRIPRRSAVIVFSAAQVYQTAEFLRVHRGGCSVVLGALSPRTRNAQVQMYQAGEVDYLVATDAIGMGLNLDLEHVTFARLRKFDGRHPRPLRAQEIGQIAGRAGRHRRDGTFSTTPEVGGLDEAQVAMVENHDYPPIQHLSWRNPTLEFDTLDALRRSLDTLPQDPHLQRLRQGEDQLALEALVQEPRVKDLCRSPAAVRLLWDVCQIPDFRKSLTDQHHSLQQALFSHLICKGQIPEVMVEEQIERLNKDSGDIDTLVARIAAIRTWAYITHRGDWVAQSPAWAAQTRAVDDKLSDALHKRLTQRFVDRRVALLVQKLKGGGPLMCEIGEKGEVSVEGTPVGTLKGLAFHPDGQGSGGDQAALLTAARRGLGPEIAKRLAQLEADNDGAFRLNDAGALLWREAAVGRLIGGENLWSPQISIDPNEFLDASHRERIATRLAPWLKSFLKNRLAPFYVLQDPRLSGTAKGLAYQIWEAGGLISRPNQETVKALTETDKALLAELKIQFTRRAVYVRSVFNAKIWPLRALLWRLFYAHDFIPELPPADTAALTHFPAFKGVQAYLRQFGYVAVSAGGSARLYVRADGLNRLEGKLYALFKNGSEGVFVMPPDIGVPLGLSGQALNQVLAACSYQPTKAPSAPEAAKGDVQKEGPGDVKSGDVGSGDRTGETPIYYRRVLAKRRTVPQPEAQARLNASSPQGQRTSAKAKAKARKFSPKPNKSEPHKSQREAVPNPDSPFAVLAVLKK